MDKKMSIRVIVIFVFVLSLNNLLYGQKSVLSSRWFHPKDNTDSVSTLQLIKELKPSRVDWTYTEDPAIANLYKNAGLAFSLTLNPQLADSGSYTTIQYRIRDINGRPYTPSWMKSWSITNPYWGCVNNPMFKELFYKKAQKFMKLGAYAIFVDDALFNAELKIDKPNLHGCFCKYCIEGYLQQYNNQNASSITTEALLALLKTEIKKNNSALIKNYESYQEESVISFLKNLKASLLNINPTAKFLTNNSNGSWNDIYKVFDGGVAELSPAKLNTSFLSQAYQLASRENKTQLFTLVSNDENLQAWLCLYNYLTNHDYVIPWDILVDTRNKKRFYINLQQFKQLQSYLTGTCKSIDTFITGQVTPGVLAKVIFTGPKKGVLVILNNDPIKNPKAQFLFAANNLKKQLNLNVTQSKLIENGSYSISNLILK